MNARVIRNRGDKQIVPFGDEIALSYIAAANGVSNLMALRKNLMARYVSAGLFMNDFAVLRINLVSAV